MILFGFSLYLAEQASIKKFLTFLTTKYFLFFVTLLVTTLQAPFAKASNEYKSPDRLEPSTAKKILFFFTSFCNISSSSSNKFILWFAKFNDSDAHVNYLILILILI